MNKLKLYYNILETIPCPLSSFSFEEFKCPKGVGNQYCRMLPYFKLIFFEKFFNESIDTEILKLTLNNFKNYNEEDKSEFIIDYINFRNNIAIDIQNKDKIIESLYNYNKHFCTMDDKVIYSNLYDKIENICNKYIKI